MTTTFLVLVNGLTETMKDIVSFFIHALKELADAINTDGGHMFVALLMLVSGLFCLHRWQLPEGKELFIFALGVLSMAMKSTGKANGNVTTTTETTKTEITPDPQPPTQPVVVEVQP